MTYSVHRRAYAVAMIIISSIMRAGSRIGNKFVETTQTRSKIDAMEQECTQFSRQQTGKRMLQEELDIRNNGGTGSGDWVAGPRCVLDVWKAVPEVVDA